MSSLVEFSLSAGRGPKNPSGGYGPSFEAVVDELGKVRGRISSTLGLFRSVGFPFSTHKLVASRGWQLFECEPWSGREGEVDHSGRRPPLSGRFPYSLL